MKKTLLCVLCGLIACFAMSACIADPEKGKPDEPYGIMNPSQALYDGLDLLKPHTQPAAYKGDPEYCVVIDDGSGMKGFVSKFCSSYRAALTTVMNISIGGERTYLRASQLDGAQISSVAAGESFLNDATKAEFFREKSSDVADTIESMASLYRPNTGQVMILISDLMIPTEDGCMKAAAAIQETFLEPQNTTVGLISILGDFRGTIENLPVPSTNGTPGRILDYMVKEREANDVFRHPLYLLFMGDDRAVLAAMEKAISDLKTCGLLDNSNPVNALYFSEYGVTRREKDDVILEFALGHEDYNSANYDVRYIVRGIADESGMVQFPSQTPITEDYQQLLKSIPIAKLYTLSRGKTDGKITMNCTIPFAFFDSSLKGDPVTDKHGLLVPASSLRLANDDYTLDVDISVFSYNWNGGSKPAAWVVPEIEFIQCESKVLKVDKGTIELVISVDKQKFTQDEPLLISVGARVRVNPKWDEIAALYDFDWINDLTMNLKTYETELSQQSTTSSARFTSASTAKTPFLSSLFISGIGDQQIELMIKAIKAETDACIQTGMFGFVVRNYPAEYVKGVNWDKTDDFGGWAFSYDKAVEIKNAIRD